MIRKLLLIAALLALSSLCQAASISLAWNASVPTAAAPGVPTGYKAHCGTASGSYSIHGDAGNALTYTVPNLAAATKYYCAVTAYNAAGESGYSNEVSTTTPASSGGVAVPVATLISASAAVGGGNDAFASAFALCSCTGGFVTGDNTAATIESGEPKIIGNAGGHSVWFTWTAPAAKGMTIDTLGSNGIDTTLAVYTGSSIGALTKITEDDDSAGNRMSRIVFNTVAGTKYWIQLDGYKGTSGPAGWFGAYKLNWTQ